MAVDINEIERKYNVESVQSGDLKIWPIVRFKIWEELAAKAGRKSRTVKLNQSTLKIVAKSLFFGLRNWRRFPSSKYWVFTSSGYRKVFCQKNHDRVTEDLPDLLQGVMIFENPVALGKHYSLKSLPHPKNIVSQSFLYLGTFLFSLLYGRRRIENERFINQIIKDFEISVNYKSIIARFYGQYFFMKMVLRFKKPKMVFMVYTASSMGLIKAFKEFDVPVVELQHGVINNLHPAYNQMIQFSSTFFPDYLFTYGVHELQYFGMNNYFIKKSNVFPVGYSFIDKYRYQAPRNEEYRKKNYGSFNRIVAFSFQEPIEDFTFEFLNNVGELDPSILYLIVPRNPDLQSRVSLASNIIIERKLNIYDAINMSDIHSTVNSTCAIEALALGKPNVLIDHMGLARSYYYGIFKDSLSVKFVEPDPKEYYAAIKKPDFPPSERISNEGKVFFEKDFKKNIIDLLRKLPNIQ
ncbi:hypothetical protein ED312_18630 [Sinomicrobium pectinilyticum]|uniref:Uncharacterized protein n=1 Tax=Sinomicrobium pectinilyticum TaxID=1084421 RepID=A0A3N0E1G3_SINP1|nr:hypothetical protein [Sinomicrobium pectinilyticum]RNL81626.1 hypothetical protein ED312_18630 [Sinomicrobium pectinilyticum]